MLPSLNDKETVVTQPTGPLSGIRVIDVTTVVLGPYCSQTLGDMGADVIKVETTEGDSTRLIGPSRTPGMGSYFANLNRNKRSLAIDLKKPAAQEAILRLVETADVFVHNMRIGAAQRLGLDYARLSARNPKLIYACASGFRKGSSMQEFPAYDDLIQGVSGIASLNAGPDGAPAVLPHGRGGQAHRRDARIDDRHGLVPPREDRTGPGNSSADDGDDPLILPDRAPLARDAWRT